MEEYKKTWHLDLQFERHPQIKQHKGINLKTRLEDSRTIRNAIVHEEGKFNGGPNRFDRGLVFPRHRDVLVQEGTAERLLVGLRDDRALALAVVPDEQLVCCLDLAKPVLFHNFSLAFHFFFTFKYKKWGKIS
jgi:hypothetical protein